MYAFTCVPTYFHMILHRHTYCDFLTTYPSLITHVYTFCWLGHLKLSFTTSYPMIRAERDSTLIVLLLYDLCCGLII